MEKSNRRVRNILKGILEMNLTKSGNPKIYFDEKNIK